MSSSSSSNGVVGSGTETKGSSWRGAGKAGTPGGAGGAKGRRLASEAGMSDSADWRVCLTT
eukprot:5252210-Prorocentrum_lima.AAC.1